MRTNKNQMLEQATTSFNIGKKIQTDGIMEQPGTFKQMHWNCEVLNTLVPHSRRTCRNAFSYQLRPAQPLNLTQCSTEFASLCFAHCHKELCTLRLSAIPFGFLSLTTSSRFWVSKNGRNGKYNVGLAIAQALQHNYPSRGFSTAEKLVTCYWEPHMTDTWQLWASAEHSPYMPQNFSYC